ncbi:MAG: hypothetical protein KF901_25700 [Myxococcales bacterium]|nr:hypothetical protein [Myxococcales bacterium]
MLALLLVLTATSAASASDFWDEVKTPGLRAYRHDVSRARMALRARRLAQARDAASAAIERLPTRPEAWLVRGLAAGEAGDLASCAGDLERAHAVDAAALEDPVDGARAGELLARAGRHELAAEILGRILARMRASDGRRGLYALYGDVLLSLGPSRRAEAERAYREALRTAPHDPRAALGLALALRRSDADDEEWRELGRRVAALGRLDALLLGLDVPEVERSARRAVVLEAVGDARGARAAWASVASRGPWAEHARTILEAGR